MNKPLALLIALLPLSGCTGAGLAAFGPRLSADKLHAEVFSEAYRQMETYAIAPPAMAQLAPTTLNGLQKLDPALDAVLRPNGQLQLSRNGQLVASGPAPRESDYASWGQTTLQLLQAAQKASPPLAKATPEELYSPMLGSATASLDTFSHYKSPTMAEHDAEWRTGYGGIGVTFERRGGNFAVLDVFIDSPAAKAGLKAGDVIVGVNGLPVEKMSVEEFAKQVRGPIGTPVTLTTSKMGQLSIVRAKVRPTTVALRMEGRVAVIRISRFMPNTVGEFKDAARQAVWQKASAVVLDLQHNPGGYLDSAVEIARLLTPRGLVLRMDGRHPASHETFNAGGADILVGTPLLVLQDGLSASASEALAAALSQRGRAAIVGSTSFGKASVQNVMPLPHGGELAVTWARMVGPSGTSFFQTGVAPQLCLGPQSTVTSALSAAKALTPLQPCPKSENLENIAIPAAIAVANDPAALAGLTAKVNDLAQKR